MRPKVQEAAVNRQLEPQDHGRVALLGTGLIGGSIGLGLRAANPAAKVTGFDPDRGAGAAAIERGAVTRFVEDPSAAVEEADLVVLSLPVDLIPETCGEVAGAVGEQAIVTDVGSAKAQVVETGRRAFGDRFVGGHPMAGSERHGIEAADARLFEGAWWILTPTAETSSRAYGVVKSLVTQLKARPVAVDPQVHDSLLARLSHLPQLTASALVDVAVSGGDRDTLLGLAGGGFRDVTRIAASNPDLWVAIIRSNIPAVLDALGVLRRRLSSVEETIRDHRWPELRQWFDRSRSARLGLFSAPHQSGDYRGELVALSLLVPNRPGVLAEVTTAAGELGANIEDIDIVHSTEGGQGRLELVVAGRGPAELLVGALIGLGYSVYRSDLVNKSTKR